MHLSVIWGARLIPRFSQFLFKIEGWNFQELINFRFYLFYHVKCFCMTLLYSKFLLRSFNNFWASLLIDVVILVFTVTEQRGRWDWTLNSTCAQSFITTFTNYLAQKLLVVFKILNDWFLTSGVQTFQPVLLIIRGGNFLYYLWE